MINIKLPLPEKVSSNKIYSGMHWTKRKKLADLYHYSLLEFKDKFEIEEYPVCINFIFYFKGRLLDVDNCFFMAKLIIDGLRGINLITDDTPKYINEISITVQKGKLDEVEIVLV